MSSLEPLTSDEQASASDFVWGAKAIGREIGRTERAAFYLLENGHVRGAQKVGGQWCANRKVLRTGLGASE
jgi:hypothetical protein